MSLGCLPLFYIQRIYYYYYQTTYLNCWMYLLYHSYLQKIKEQEIKKYNQKHRAYLIRAGIMQVQNRSQNEDKRDRIMNQRLHGNRKENQDNRNQEKEQKQNQIGKKPRRQREFNRVQPSQISANNEKKPKQTNQIVDTSNQIHQQLGFSQQPNPKFVQRERPIKQNKLTQQEIQYLNGSMNPHNEKLNQNNNSKNNQKQIRKRQQQKLKPPPALEQYPPEQEQLNLLQCQICERNFRQQIIQKHVKICEKNFNKKRKPFEVKATDQQAQLLKRKSEKAGSKQQKKEQKKEPKWKKESEIFRNQLKKGRGETVQNQIVQEDTRIPCPSCGRKFNDKAAVKHIQFCTNKAKQSKK